MDEIFPRLIGSLKGGENIPEEDDQVSKVIEAGLITVSTCSSQRFVYLELNP